MKLNPREQWLVWGAAIFLLVGGVGNFLVIPLVESQRLLERKVEQKRHELADFADLEVRLARFTDRFRSFDELVNSHREGFSLFVELESIAKRAGVQEKIGSYKPLEHSVGDYREQTVDMELGGLTLEELGRLLRDIERSRESLYVKRLDISHQIRKGGGGQDLLKIKITVGTLVGRVA